VIVQLDVIVTGEEPRSVRARRAAQVIREATSARWVGIYTVADATVSCEGWSGPGAPTYPSFPVTDGLTGHALRTCSPALSNDVSRDPRYLANQEDSGSELILPVLAGRCAVGTLDVESDRTGAFGGAAIVRCGTLAAALLPLWQRSCAAGVPAPLRSRRS
jgi:putative methionine-R-sulfoxide reductase with GAF domain